MPREQIFADTFVDLAWYRLFNAFMKVFFAAIAPIRSSGTHHIPTAGRLLIISNHQSLLDPFVMATTCPRRLYFVGKREIFDKPIIGRAAQSYGIFPVDRDKADLTAAKMAIGLLRHNHALVILPEGTRTPDGQIHAFDPGFVKFAMTTRCPILPAAIGGAWEVWPTGRDFPRRGRVSIEYGQLLDPPSQAGRRPSSDAQAEFASLVREQVIALARSLV